MFCDKTEVTFIGGRGGDGFVSFRREKFVPYGGPDGGDGGHGGDITLVANPNINTLTEFNKYKKFAAENGTPGHKKNKTGKCGTELILKVPCGTMLFDSEDHKLITDLSNPGDKFTIARGGKGGLGNARFVSSTQQAPKFAETGEKGEIRTITMELKMVAEVGIIGLPSAGKSTLISRISNSKPKIAAYHFTTLIPNLGVISMQDFGGSKEDSFVVADIPGLIPGAHAGKGLGHEFLRHISRTHILVHLLDGTLENIVENLNDINNELAIYDQKLQEQPENQHLPAHLIPQISKEEQIVVINKIDSLIPEITTEQIKELEAQNPKLKGKIHLISAVTGEGLKELMFAINKARQELKAKQVTEEPVITETPANDSETTDSEHKIFRPHLEKRAKAFSIELINMEKVTKKPSVYYDTGSVRLTRKERIERRKRQKILKQNPELATPEEIAAQEKTEQQETTVIRRTFRVSSQRLEQIANMTDWYNQEAIERIYRHLEKHGIQKQLKKEGAQEDDILLISEFQLKFRK